MNVIQRGDALALLRFLPEAYGCTAEIANSFRRDGNGSPGSVISTVLGLIVGPSGEPCAKSSPTPTADCAPRKITSSPLDRVSTRCGGFGAGLPTACGAARPAPRGNDRARPRDQGRRFARRARLRLAVGRWTHLRSLDCLSRR